MLQGDRLLGIRNEWTRQQKLTTSQRRRQCPRKCQLIFADSMVSSTERDHLERIVHYSLIWLELDKNTLTRFDIRHFDGSNVYNCTYRGISMKGNFRSGSNLQSFKTLQCDFQYLDLKVQIQSIKSTSMDHRGYCNYLATSSQPKPPK